MNLPARRTPKLGTPGYDSGMPLRFDILRSLGKWEALSAEWLRLWASNDQARPFQRPEWLLPWWRQFGQPDLRVVTLRRNGSLLGLIPAYVYHNTHSGERQLLFAGAGTSDYLDGIFSPACTPDNLLEALDLLREEGGWDVAHLTQLPPSSPLYQALERFPGTRPYAGESCGQCHAVAVKKLPSKLRADVLYQRNAAAGLGRLTLTFAEERTWKPFFEDLVRFHTERWESAGEPGVLADPLILAHHREALPELLASGAARLCALQAGPHRLGVLYSLLDPPDRQHRTEYFYLMGFAPQHARLQPGLLLMAFAVEHAAQEGIRTIDMLRGNETYKKFWHVQQVPTFGFTFARQAPAWEANLVPASVQQ